MSRLCTNSRACGKSSFGDALLPCSKRWDERVFRTAFAYSAVKKFVLMADFCAILNAKFVVRPPTRRLITSIEHLYSPRTFTRRALEALRPGGVLILTTPYWGYLKNLMIAVTNRTDRSLTALWEGGHIKHWSRQTLQTLGERQGFEFVAFEGAGRPIPFLWKGMMMVFRKPLD